MSTEELLEKLLESLAKPVPPPFPIEVALWDTKNIGAYLKRSVDTVRDDIVCLPSFPRPIRLPTSGRAQALYKAREVIKWAESHSVS